MAKYRKKPVVIEAVQFDGSWESAKPILEWMEEALSLEATSPTWMDINGGEIYIWTLEGRMIASKGDFIIKGVKNEFYPCKPEIFEATYELVE